MKILISLAISILGQSAFGEVGRLVEAAVVTTVGEESFTVEARVRAKHTTLLASEVSGYLGSILDLGARVSANEPVAEFDTTYLKIESRRWSSRVEHLSTMFEIRRRQLGRQLDSYTSGAVADAIVDSSRLDLAQVQKELSEAQANRDRVQATLGRLVLNAPHAGTITDVFADPGEYLAAGQPIFELQSTADTHVLVSLPAEVGLALGSEASAVVETGSERRGEYPAFIFPGGEQALGVYRARVPVPSGNFEIGQRVQVELRYRQTGVLVPPKALVSDGEGNHVFVIEESDLTVRRADLGVVSILTGGVLVRGALNPGERVVTAGAELLSHGDLIRVGSE
ncbi:MAG: hypothetical protein CMQ43_01410 [Gammaproteobacteria bacterium]|nr:hypothetical protein [Gammaproteobacteria bacterium]|tara:strand:- start:19698 stop:20717 length:1020 start_codon:yes stop_codon:yes gene_type:complete